MTKLVLVLALIPFLAFPDAHAATRRGARQHNQRARIHQGVKSGALTQDEASDLRQEQRKIRRKKRKAAADGTVTAGEKARIEKMQDKASQDIYQEKHDDESRANSDSQE